MVLKCGKESEWWIIKKNGYLTRCFSEKNNVSDDVVSAWREGRRDEEV